MLLRLEYLKTAPKKDTMIEEIKTTENTKQLNGFSHEDIGDDHLFTGLQTPMKANAFKLSDTDKKEKDCTLIFRNNGCHGA